MAKNELTLLQEIIGQLRMLNKSSVRDRLREAEEAKRAEKLAMVTEESTTQGGVAMDAQTDFQRRYLAAQAGALTDRALTDAPVGVVQKVIAKSSDKIHGFVKDTNRVTKIWRLQELHQWRVGQKQRKDDKREEIEHGFEDERWHEKLLEPLERHLRNWQLRRERRMERWDMYKEAWSRKKWAAIIGLVTSIYAISEGMHTAFIRVIKAWGRAYTAVRTWPVSITKMQNAINTYRYAVMKWFGFDTKGKPIPLKEPIAAEGMWSKIQTQMKNVRTSFYKMVGLGPDGKKLGHKWVTKVLKSGQEVKVWQAISKTAPITQGYGTGTFKTITGQIGKILAPLLRAGSAITNFFAGKTGKLITDGLEKIKALGSKPWLVFLRKILWPVTVLFTIWEGFKAGKEEAEREGSNWVTIIAEATGGMVGFFFGAIWDLFKDGTIWIIKKAFGIKSDKDGNILPGQGFGADVLAIVDKFNFAKTIQWLIAAPWHLISNVVGFIKNMIFSADYRAGAWEWIKNIGPNMINWMKSLVPDWEWSWGGKNYSLRKLLGIDIGPEMGDQTYTPWGAAVDAMYKDTKINPNTGVEWLRGEKGTFLSALKNDEEKQKAYEKEQEALMTKRALELMAIQKANEGISPGNPGYQPVVNYNTSNSSVVVKFDSDSNFGDVLSTIGAAPSWPGGNEIPSFLRM